VSTEQLKQQADRQWPAAQRDLCRPGRTPAVREYYRTLQRLQARLRKQAARREVTS